MARKTIFLLFCLFTGSLQAQQTFTDVLTSQKAGEGKVVVVQDERIKELVDGSASKTPAKNASTSKKASDDKPKKEASRQQLPPHQAESTKTVSSTPPSQYALRYRTRYKATGYRIQVFTGGNSRADRARAYEIEQKCRTAFPELSVYIHFISPRWICRVGDFQSYNDAQKYLSRIRRAGISNEAIVVKTTVLLAR